MILPTTVYTADQGYAWSNAVEGMTVSKLNQLYRYISAARGDFPDPLSVDVGLVSDGETAAAFTIQNVEHWDSEGRSSEYAAFALFPVARAAEIDFVDLLNNDFFWTPTHAPQASIDYAGGPSETVPSVEIRSLVTDRACLLRNPRAVGSVLAKYGAKSSRWVCLMKAENILKIECNRWT